jgi:hypothetical protein
VLCGYLPVIILFRLGLEELAVRKKFVNLIPEEAILSILGVLT